MNHPKKILIAGAGLIGPTLAIALTRLGHEVHIFEKRDDIRKQSQAVGRSINLVLTAKGLKTLSELGLLQQIKEITVPIIGRMMHSIDKEHIFQPYGRNDSEHNLSVSRLELNKLLIDNAEAEGVFLHFNSSLLSLDLTQKKAFFSDQEMNYDLFFGADGAGSQTRRELEKVFNTESQVESLGVSYLELSMPAHKEMPSHCLHIWPRGDHMLMALANLDKSFTMTLYLTQKRFEQLQQQQAFQDYFKTFYPDAYDFMPKVMDEIQKNVPHFLGTLHCEHWYYQNQLALIGDAAHAMVPFFGQGTNCGLHDISILINCIKTHSDDWNKILENYSLEAKNNGQAMQKMSIENWNIMSTKVADQEFLKQKAIERSIEAFFPHLYRSRYGLITYTLTPYKTAYQVGEIQKQFLQKLSLQTSDPKGLKKEAIEDALKRDYLPHLESLDISLERYNP